ncbi:MAG: nicotinate-nucleotide adenylyltransferase [Alphaproteobacteria bacterium]|nr:nicotinate-nucleotide adenylyltransferase [Alphaproteobacteria bacterium]
MMPRLPPHSPGQRIGLFGGSFNPAHEGHRQVALYALKKLRLDWVWWLVSPQNPLKDTSETAAYAQRFAQTKALARHPRFVVTDIESQIGSRTTIETLRALKHYADAQFVWIMGADSLAGLHHWHDWKEIVETVPLAVLARPGYSIRALGSVAALRYLEARVPMESPQVLAAKHPPAWAFISMPLRKESSTAIRAAQS